MLRVLSYNFFLFLCAALNCKYKAIATIKNEANRARLGALRRSLRASFSRFFFSFFFQRFVFGARARRVYSGAHSPHLHQNAGNERSAPPLRLSRALAPVKARPRPPPEPHTGMPVGADGERAGWGLARGWGVWTSEWVGVVWVWVCVGVGMGEGVGVGVLLSRRHRGAASMRSSKRAQWRHETDSVSIAEYARCCVVAQWWVWGGWGGCGAVPRGKVAPTAQRACSWRLSGH